MSGVFCAASLTGGCLASYLAFCVNKSRNTWQCEGGRMEGAGTGATCCIANECADKQKLSLGFDNDT